MEGRQKTQTQSSNILSKPFLFTLSSLVSSNLDVHLMISGTFLFPLPTRQATPTETAGQNDE